MRLIFKITLGFLLCWSHLLSAQKLDISLASGLVAINEKCALLNNEIIQLVLDSAAKQDIRFAIILGGTSVKSTDYATNIPDTVLFATGDRTKTFDLTVFNDGSTEGDETITIIARSNTGITDTLVLTINDHIARIQTTQDTFNKCSNEPFELKVSRVGRSSITWFPADMVQATADSSIFIISPVRTSSIVMTALIDNCVERDTIYVVSQPIGVTLNTQDTLYLCFPDSFRLVANIIPSNAIVSWLPLDSTTRFINATNIQVKPPKSATYVIQVVSGVCRASDTVFVRMDSLRDTKVDHFPKKDKYCKGDSIFFFGQRHPRDLFPSIMAMWDPSNGFQTPADTFNAVIQADVTTTYFRTTRNNACIHRDSVYIKVVEPSIPVGPVDTTVCPGTTIQITFQQDTSSYKDFKWTPQDGLINCSTCSDPKIKVNGMQMYKVEAKKDGCDATTEITTNVHQKPNVRVVPDPPLLAGSDIRLSLLGTEGLKAYSWKVDGTSVPAGTLIYILVKATPGNHTATVEYTDANGCMWNDNFPIQVICPDPTLMLQRSPLGNIYEGTTLTISAVGISTMVTGVRWSANGNNLNQNALTITHKVTNAGLVTYRFEATDVNGCPLVATIAVTVIPCISPEELKKKIPNAFSPNNDEKNDFFNYTDGSLSITKILVFSRWGQLVYNNTDPENGWDGKINGTDAASDVYIYRLTYICGDGAPLEVSGTVTLLR